jgi:RHS repeat-associated protein
MNGRLFQYDQEGRLLEDGLRTYHWNDQGKLLGTSDPQNSLVYQYDAVGRRISKARLGAASVGYLWDDLNVIEIKDEGVTTDLLETLQLDEIWGMRSDKIEGTVRDRLNSIIAVIGSEIISRSYDEFGEQGASNTHLFFGFTGREQDINNLIYMRARYYDPELGRFISEDPVSDINNSFSYADNEPTSRIDPTGLQTARSDLAEDAAFTSLDSLLSESETPYPYFSLAKIVGQRLRNPNAQLDVSQALTIAGAVGSLFELPVFTAIITVGTFTHLACRAADLDSRPKTEFNFNTSSTGDKYETIFRAKEELIREGGRAKTQQSRRAATCSGSCTDFINRFKKQLP